MPPKRTAPHRLAFPPRRLSARGIAAALLLTGFVTCAAGARADDAVSAQVAISALQRSRVERRVEALGTVRSAGAQTLHVTFERAVLVRRVLVRAGQAVHRGALLLEVASTPAERAAFTRARDALRFARAELARVRDLAARQLATQSQVDSARKTVADASAALAAARAQGLGDGLHKVLAPFDGVVETLSAAPGARLAAGSDALSLAPRSGLQAVLGVSPADARQLHAGLRTELHSVFDPALHTQATVLSVAGRVDSATARVEVVLALPASARWLLPGLAVQAGLPTRSWSGWVVPRQAVLQAPSGQAYVFQDRDGHALRVNVRVDAEQGEHSVISGPLQPRLPLVVLGNYELHDGMALRVGNAAGAQ